MTRDLCLTVALLASATVSTAQSMGTLTENGVAMEVKAAEVDALLVGAVKDGQEVTLTSTGSDSTGGTTLAWKLKLKTTVPAFKGS